MITKIRYIGSGTLDLDIVSLSYGDEYIFNPMIFTHSDIGMISHYHYLNKIEYYVKHKLISDYNEGAILFNDLLNTTPERGFGMPTTIEGWRNIGEIIGFDYKYVRGKIIDLAAIKTSMYSNWEALIEVEKDIVATYVACPKVLVESHFGVFVALDIFEKWAKDTKKSREDRWERAKVYVFSCLEESDAKSILVELTEGKDLVTRYISGIEGTLEDNGQEGLIDYVSSRVNTSYENVGLVNKHFTPKQGTMQDVSDGAVQILKYGIY